MNFMKRLLGCLQPLVRPLVATQDKFISISSVSLHIKVGVLFRLPWCLFGHFIDSGMLLFLLYLDQFTCTNIITSVVPFGIIVATFTRVRTEHPPCAAAARIIVVWLLLFFVACCRADHLEFAQPQNSILISQRAAHYICYIHPNPV